MKKYFLICLMLAVSFPLFSQSISASELIQKSIQYHDPEGELLENEVFMYFIETRSGGDDRQSAISFDLKKQNFQMMSNKDGLEIISEVAKGEVKITIDGNDEISEDQKEKYRLTPERTKMMKDYYEYLWLMPMKLNDPGTLIDPAVKEVEFFGKESLAVKVSYSEEVGKDTWYFYFHPETFAMHGYRFYHDESKNDGEYILLEEETIYKSVRLPKRRTWYTHKEDKLLGTDILEGLSF